MADRHLVPYLPSMRPFRVVALVLAAVSATSCVTRQSVSSSVAELPAGTEAVSLFNEPFTAPALPAISGRPRPSA